MKIEKCSYCKKPSQGEFGVRHTINLGPDGVECDGVFYDFCSTGCATRVSLHVGFGFATFDNGHYKRIA